MNKNIFKVYYEYKEENFCGSDLKQLLDGQQEEF